MNKLNLSSKKIFPTTTIDVVSKLLVEMDNVINNNKWTHLGNLNAVEAGYDILQRLLLEDSFVLVALKGAFFGSIFSTGSVCEKWTSLGCSSYLTELFEIPLILHVSHIIKINKLYVKVARYSGGDGWVPFVFILSRHCRPKITFRERRKLMIYSLMKASNESERYPRGVRISEEPLRNWAYSQRK